MALSPAHRLGQIIGDLVEEVMASLLGEFCNERGLYLDTKGERKPARKGRKVSWEDKHGNSHDLDLVIEKGGTKGKRGRPLAFIEVAWRRYTKHSRNKAQEIQGAILPIAEKYAHDKPFLGCVLAGVFTAASLEQMRSSGFTLVQFSYETIIGAFAAAGIRADFDEDTGDEHCQSIIDEIARLPSPEKDRIKRHLMEANSRDISAFLNKLGNALDRRVAKVFVIPLHGEADEFGSAGMAMEFIAGYSLKRATTAFYRFEILVEFNNADKINASFREKKEAINFLQYIGGK